MRQKETFLHYPQNFNEDKHSEQVPGRLHASCGLNSEYTQIVDDIPQTQGDKKAHLEHFVLMPVENWLLGDFFFKSPVSGKGPRHLSQTFPK